MSLPRVMRGEQRPAKLAHRGVLIERPCLSCDTVDTHFEGRCNTGPCATCGKPRFASPYYIESHGWGDDHKWVAPTYYPADIDTDVPAFEAMLDAVKSTGWPEYFTSDLFRDYQDLSGTGAYSTEPPTRFVWVLTPTGTHLITHPNTLSTVCRLWTQHRVFAWDSRYTTGTLIEVSRNTDIDWLHKALQFLSRDGVAA